jgi:hypothetical protein
MLTSPLVIKGGVSGAYRQQFNVQGAGIVELIDILQFLATNGGGGGGGSSVYLSDNWVIKGTSGIAASSSAPGQYAVTIPEGGVLETLQKRITDLGQINDEGNIILNIDWSTTVFNQSSSSPMTPFVSFLDSLGNQFSAGELGLSVKTAIAVGITSTTISIQDAISLPFTLKIVI